MANTKTGILITGNAVEHLRDHARFLGVKPEELANRILEQYLKEHADVTVDPDDERYKKAATLILKRNSKLYKRLA
jgi:hypothetical protein